MLPNEMWKIFENTGNLEAYLYYKRHQEIFEEGDQTDYPIAVNDNSLK